MDLSPYVESFHTDLIAAAAAGTDQTQEIARQLGAAADAALRLCLLDALSAMAAEVTAGSELGTVDIRMHGREPQIVVTAAQPVVEQPAPAVPEDAEDGSTARITLRLPEGLKVRAERAAAAEGQSMNAWLVRAVSAAASPSAAAAGRIGRRMTGYARS